MKSPSQGCHTVQEQLPDTDIHVFSLWYLMLPCSTTTSGFAVPFASNGRHKLIPLCGRCQDALSVIALSHLYPELGILARVLARKRKKKAFRKNRLFFFLFRVLGHAERKRKSGLIWNLLWILPPFLFSLLYLKAWLFVLFLVSWLYLYLALPKEKTECRLILSYLLYQKQLMVRI